jgi:hypothetical protein
MIGAMLGSDGRVYALSGAITLAPPHAESTVQTFLVESYVYRAVLRVLEMPSGLIQTHVHSILAWTPMPKAGRVPGT